MSLPLLDPQTGHSEAGTGRWMVTIYNNERNSMEEVVLILMHATGCDADEAYIEMWEAHHYGKAPVHFAEREECDLVAEIIASIGVRTSVSREWE